MCIINVITQNWIMKYWIKIDRFAAWVLLVGMTLYFISGYGMAKGIFDASLATKSLSLSTPEQRLAWR